MSNKSVGAPGGFIVGFQGSTQEYFSGTIMRFNNSENFEYVTGTYMLTTVPAGEYTIQYYFQNVNDKNNTTIYTQPYSLTTVSIIEL